MGFFGDALRWGLAPVTGGASLAVDGDTFGVSEDTMSRIPVVGQLTGAESDEQKALVKKQEQLAREAELRRAQTQNASMNALGTRMLAFNPRNQLMAQMFGPQAAFTPEQMAGMVQSPMGGPPPPDPSLINYAGTDPAKRAQLADYTRQLGEFQGQEQQRHDRVAGGMTPLGPGPAPLQQRRPAPGRRY